MFAAMILAAGASTRMGYPKALLPYRGRPFLAGILDAAFAAGFETRVVVLGYYADKIKNSIDLTGVVVAVSSELESGPIGSIRAGLKALESHPVEGVLVWPVDRPHVQVATISALLDACRQTRQPVVVPAFRGRRGHPVLFGRAVFAELAAAPAGEGARAVVRRDRSRVIEVPVPDSAVLEDLNTPEDYQGLLRREDQVRGD
jgi:molybdenum cofactor cytidylyltransferase